jgi:PAS domain S-box-containing protein
MSLRANLQLAGTTDPATAGPHASGYVGFFLQHPLPHVCFRLGQLVAVNAAFEALMGFAPQTFLPQIWNSPQDADTRLIGILSSQVPQILREGRAILDVQIPRRHLAPVWVQLHGWAFDPTDVAPVLVFSLTNIDESRQWRERGQQLWGDLAWSNRQLAALLESLPMAVLWRDGHSGRFLGINGAGENLLGVERQQLLGRSWHEIYSKAFADWFAELDRRALADPVGIRRDGDRILTAGGDARVVRQKVFCLNESGPNGRRLLVSFLQDITGENQAQSQVADWEARFRQVAANADDFVFLARQQLHNLTFVNDRAHELTGFLPEEILSEPVRLRSLLAEAERREFDRSWPRLAVAVRRLRVAQFTVQIQHPQKGLRLIRVVLNPVRESDQSIGILGVANDITDAQGPGKLVVSETGELSHDELIRRWREGVRIQLTGIFETMRQMVSGNPGLAPYVEEISAQIESLACAQGIPTHTFGRYSVLDMVQSVFENLSAQTGADVHFESDDPGLWNWGIIENESVTLAMVLNEIGGKAIRVATTSAVPVSVRATTQGDAMEIQVTCAAPAPLTAPVPVGGSDDMPFARTMLPRRGMQLLVRQSADGDAWVLTLGQQVLQDLFQDF